MWDHPGPRVWHPQDVAARGRGRPGTWPPRDVAARGCGCQGGRGHWGVTIGELAEDEAARLPWATQGASTGVVATGGVANRSKLR
jgi:hypothetical protein